MQKEQKETNQYLEQDEMDEIKNKLRPTKPKIIVRDLYKRYSLDYSMSLCDFEGHLCYYCLKLCPNS